MGRTPSPVEGPCRSPVFARSPLAGEALEREGRKRIREMGRTPSPVEGPCRSPVSARSPPHGDDYKKANMDRIK